MRDVINIFDAESYSAGGYFNDGTYRVETARFTYFDFNGKANSALCLRLQLQPIVDGNDQGEVAVQYWPIFDTDKEGNKTVEPASPVRGEKGCWSQIRLTESNTHDKLFGGSPFKKFIDSLLKQGFDGDSAANDISAIDGLVAEFGKMVEKRRAATAVEQAEGQEQKQRRDTTETIIVTNIPKAANSSNKPNPKADVKPVAKAKEAAKHQPDTPEELVAAYLQDQVCTEENTEGAPHLTHRLKLASWLTKEMDCDPDTTKAAMAVYNNDAKINAILNTFGWEKAGKLVKKSE